MKYILIFVCFMNFNNLAQDFYLGFGLGTNMYKQHDVYKSVSSYEVVLLPSEFHLALEYLPIKELGLEFRIGRVVQINHSSFTGIEYSFLTKYYIIHSVYLMGNYTIHNNFAAGGNNGPSSNTFGIPGIGIGYRPIEFLCMDLTYLDPKDTEIEHYYDWETPGPQLKIVKVKWLIRLNVGLYIPL